MPDESDGVIERAAALLRRPGSPRPEHSVGDEPRRSPDPGRSTDQRQLPGGIGRAGPPAPFDGTSQVLPAPTIEHEEWSLRHLLRAAALHKVALIATALLVFAASAAVIFSLTPRYTAVAVVSVGGPAPSIATRIQSDVDGSVVQLSPDAAAVRTQVDYLRSRPVAERAMDQLNLWNLPEFDPAARQHRGFAALGVWIGSAVERVRALAFGRTAPGKPDAAADLGLARRDRAVDVFLTKLTVDAEQNSQIITVQFVDPDPQLAAAAANAVADGYIARQIDMASTASQQATAGLEQAVAALRKRVAQSDQAYEQYRGVFEVHSGHELLNKAAENASQQLAAAETERQVIEARLAALQGVGGKRPTAAATSEITTSRVMQALHEQESGLEGQLAELSSTLGDANPKIQQVRAAIARVHGEMGAEVGRQLAALQGELKAATAKEAALRQSLASSRTQSAQASPGEARLDALKTEADANRAVLNAFLTRLNEANTSAKLLPRANAQVVAHASVPRSPSFPKIKLLLAVAVVGSTMAGFGAAVLREKSAPTFRSGEEIELETGTRTLALVPQIDNPQASPEEALGSPASFYGEAIRTLYMTLSLRQGLKTLVVTSARASDGKTTLAASLALIAAKSGRKVLLVDADLCTAGASRLFRLSGHEGLAELVVGGGRFAELVATAGADPNFHFLPAGAPNNVLAARSGLEAALGLFRRLRDEYDLIVVDSPPVLAVADAMALSAQADATLFAVRWGATPRAAVKLGLRRLHASATSGPVGAVLTMVDAREHSRFGYADSAFYTKDLVAYYRPRA